VVNVGLQELNLDLTITCQVTFDASKTYHSKGSVTQDYRLHIRPYLVTGNRRVTIDPALTASSKAATSKKKTKVRSTEPSKASRRSASKGSDIEEEDQDDEEDDALNGSQDANRYCNRLPIVKRQY
jgi:hypothetical protein